FVQIDEMIGPVITQEFVDQLRHAVDRKPISFVCRIPESPNLPEQDMTIGINITDVHQKVRRLERLATDDRIDAEICEEAVFGGNRRQHPRFVSFRTSTPNRFMRGIYENAGMAIYGEADPLAGSDIVENNLDHLPIGLHSFFVLAVEM